MTLGIFNLLSESLPTRDPCVMTAVNFVEKPLGLQTCKTLYFILGVEVLTGRARHILLLEPTNTELPGWFLCEQERVGQHGVNIFIIWLSS